MNVLFIGRRKRNGKLSPVLLAQADSLKKSGVNIHFFAIDRGGIAGYLNAWFKLRKLISSGRYDLYHAHYYASGILAILSGSRPLVVSLMGSELKSGYAIKRIAGYFANHFWGWTVVKSGSMHKDLGGGDHISVIPNGVDLMIFKPLDQSYCLKKAGFESSSKHILFISDPARKEKNFRLAANAMKLLSDIKVELHCLFDIEHNEIPVYMSAADLLLLTSYHEGSPNVVKEAMACNLPVVSTDVGDVRHIIHDTEGCFIAAFNETDIAAKIRSSLELNKKSDGRKRIVDLGLDSVSVAEKLIGLYHLVTQRI